MTCKVASSVEEHKLNAGEEKVSHTRLIKDPAIKATNTKAKGSIKSANFARCPVPLSMKIEKNKPINIPMKLAVSARVVVSVK